MALPSRLFCDTSFFYACHDPNDTHHARAEALTADAVASSAEFVYRSPFKSFKPFNRYATFKTLTNWHQARGNSDIDAFKPFNGLTVREASRQDSSTAFTSESGLGITTSGSDFHSS